MAETHHVNYRKIYFILLGLLLVSVAGPFIGIKWITLVTAFGIAVVKANLVIQNFMHLRWERTLMKFVLSASLVLMFLFFFGVSPDVMKHSGRNWENDAAQAATARGIAPPHVPGAEPEHGAAAPETAAHDTAAAPAAAFDGAAAFGTVCASCHGAGGAGDGMAAAALNPRPANFRDPAFWRGKTDEYLARVIREGGAAVGKSASMPPWGSLYTQEQALAIVAHLRTLQPR